MSEKRNLQKKTYILYVNVIQTLVLPLYVFILLLFYPVTLVN